MSVLSVVDLMPEGCDGTGHWAECPCAPSCLTDGQGGFFVYHNDFHEQIIERQQ